MSTNTTVRNKGYNPSSSNKANFLQKFSTPSEQFFQFTKSLGYETPKNLKHEHLDYMLKNDKSGLFVKKLMSKIKTENILSQDEVDQYDLLTKDGMILYGKDLERAVQHRTALDKKKTEDDRTEALRTEELQRLITLRQQEIIELQKQDQVLRIISEKKQKSEESKQALRSQYQRESDNLDIAIQVARKRVGDKLEKLKEIKAAVLNRFESHKGGGGKFMVDWDWETFLEHEDKLGSLVEEFIVDHVPNLIIESEGYNNERCQEENRIEEAISEYVDAFERLKHSIVYEEVRKLKLTTELEHERAKLRLMLNKDKGSIKGCLKRGIDMKQVEKDLDTRNDEQMSLLKKERSETVHAVRDVAAEEVDRKFYALVESRNRAKRRLETFISRIYEILEAQKVRIDVVRHLMHKEIDQFVDLETDLVNLENRLAGLNITNGTMVNSISNPEEGRAFQFQSFQESFNNKNTSKSEGNGFSIDTLENVEHEEQLKKLSRNVNHMKSKLERLKLVNITCDQVHVLKSQIQDHKVLLEAMQEEDSILQSVAEKMQLLEAMQAALSKHNSQQQTA